MERDELIALLGLNAVPGLGPRRLTPLLQKYGSAVDVAAACPQCLIEIHGGIAVWPREQVLEEGRTQWRQLRGLGARILAVGSERLPTEWTHLEQIRGGQAPPVVIYRGNANCILEPVLRVAIVGSRACTPYGREQAYRLGAGLAAAGAVVVSGAARGIDQAAMRGALSAGGQVVAVLGSGLDRPYPPDAGALLEAIVESGGCVMTEFGCRTTPARGNFPRRNRLIAALARGTVVVEAGPKSGSMNTVDWCNQLGREVFAVPGPVNGICSRGPHQLLREGAHFTENVQDVLAQFELVLPKEIMVERCPVLEVLSRGDLSLEGLAHELGRSPDDLLPELMELEIEGKLIRMSGGYYHRLGPTG